MLGHAIEFHQSTLGVAPKALNTVDMGIAPGKLIVAMVHSKVLVKANIHQPIVATPSICMDHTGHISFASDNGL